ncbi:hypothetical protein BH10PLA2_BH10PLA2_17050 [soil metagenome]
MYRTLLATLDGSEFSEQALPVAASIVRRTGGVLQIVQAHSPITKLSRESDFVVDMTLDDEIRRVETDYLGLKQAKPGSVFGRSAAIGGGHIFSVQLVGRAVA